MTAQKEKPLLKKILILQFFTNYILQIKMDRKITPVISLPLQRSVKKERLN